MIKHSFHIKVHLYMYTVQYLTSNTIIKQKLNHVTGTLTNKFTLITFAKIILQHVVHRITCHVYSLFQLCDINAKLSSCIVTDQYIYAHFSVCIICSDTFPQLFSCQTVQICILRWSSLDFKF